MAQLEIGNDGKAKAIVELGEEPLPVGFDSEGRVAWGRGRIARAVGEILGNRLVTPREQRALPEGEEVEFGGLTLVYRSAGGDPGAVALQAIAPLLLSAASTDELLGRLLDSLGRHLAVRRCAIATLDDDEVLAVRAARGEGLVLQPTLTRAVLESGTAILTSEAEVTREGGDGLDIVVRSVLCAPLRSDGESRGVLYADNDGRATSFTNAELDFVSALSHLAAFTLASLGQTERLREENSMLRNRLGIGGRAVFASGAMAEVARKIEKVSGFDATVLITGESGVGKELVAAEIHGRSPRRDQPFIAVNCAAIPETLLESELFGYAPQSAISGADPKGRAGKFELAHGGTIFLDEIGEMVPALQAKLLRVLQDKRIDRLGDVRPREIDVRILVATNQDLEQLVAKGEFREDLFYRLHVVAIEVPPLRERREDIPLLAEFFVRSYPGPDALRRAKLSRAALRALIAHDWPGNVRELKNCIEQALILGDGRTIRLGDLPPRLQKPARGLPDDSGTLAEDLPSMTEVEKEHVARVLKATGWNKARSARILGISKPTLYDKIRSFGLAPDA